MKEKDFEGHRVKVGLEQQQQPQHKLSSSVTKSSSPPKSSIASSTASAGPVESSGKSTTIFTAPASTGGGASVSGTTDESIPNSTSQSNNFDDDYNEWDISIGNLIIDLDADIERQSEGDKSETTGSQDKVSNNQKGAVEVTTTTSASTTITTTTTNSTTTTTTTTTSNANSNSSNSSTTSTTTITTTNKPSEEVAKTKLFAHLNDSVSVMSSNLKPNRSNNSQSGNSGISHSGGALSANNGSNLAANCNATNTPNGTSTTSPAHHQHGHSQRSYLVGSSPSSTLGNSTSKSAATLVEHHATVDKGLKMKIKRKSIGGKISETKHEIVSSDISPTSSKSAYISTFESNASGNGNIVGNSVTNMTHGTNLSKSVINTNEGVHSPLGDASPVLSSSASKSSKHSSKNKSGHREKKDRNKLDRERVSSKSKPTEENSDFAFLPSTSQPGVPNLTIKYSSTSSPTVIIKNDDAIRNDAGIIQKKPTQPDNIEDHISERRDIGTSTSVATITEPECLGPCEPGTSVTLEGIVWQETEGGVLVVNVTWRGKTYVGTLLDCTKHDWAPPRFCESPISDIESKSLKNTRAKRSRNSFALDASIDTRSVTSKLRNGKGRRTANSGFIPPSPAKSESSFSNNSKRKGRPGELDLSSVEDGNGKRNRISGSHETQLPASPTLIECPEPNCSKKYKHINGLKYHQSHAHIGSSYNISDSQDGDNGQAESTKDDNYTSDGDMNDSSVPDSPSKEITHNGMLEKSKNGDPLQLTSDGVHSPNSDRCNSLSVSDESKHSAIDQLVPEYKQTNKGDLIGYGEELKNVSVSEHTNQLPAGSTSFNAHSVSELSASASKSLDSSRLMKDDMEIKNVASPAYSDISDDSNSVDNCADRPNMASAQSGDISDNTSLESATNAQNAANFNLSFPSFFKHSQYLVSGTVDSSNVNENTGKGVNESVESGTEQPGLVGEKSTSSHNSYPYSSFYRYGGLPSHETPKTTEIGKPINVTSTVTSQSTISPTNSTSGKSGEFGAEAFSKDKINTDRQMPKENIEYNGKQLITELQNMKNRIPNYTFDQGSLHDNNHKRFVSDIEKEKYKEKANKHSPQNCKSIPVKVDDSKEKGNVGKNSSGVADEGVKPTMETTGPPPPPTNGYYYNPSYLSPFSPISPFENIFRGGPMNPVVMGGPYGPPGSSFLHSQMRFPGMPGSLEGISIPSTGARSSPSTHTHTTTTNSGMAKSNSQHSVSSYNQTAKPDRSMMSPTSGASTMPNSGHSLNTSASSFHKSPNKEFVTSHNSINHHVPSNPPDQRNPMMGGQGSLHPPPPRHPMHPSSHVGYPIYDPFSAMIVNHASNPVQMHPFAPK